MADSSTDATHSTTSPSPGLTSPAETMTKSPARSLEPGTVSVLPLGRRRLASVSDLARRRVSACALPRPSAMASAKFANNTVNHSHAVICRSKPNAGLFLAMSLIRRAVVITLPTSTTNMTGFFIMVRGFSLRIASFTAWRTIFGSHNDFDLPCLLPINSLPPQKLERPVQLALTWRRRGTEKHRICATALPHNHILLTVSAPPRFICPFVHSSLHPSLFVRCSQ